MKVWVLEPFELELGVLGIYLSEAQAEKERDMYYSIGKYVKGELLIYERELKL